MPETQFVYYPPKGTVALSGEVHISGGDFLTVLKVDFAKQLQVNENKFILSDMTQDQIDGGIVVVCNIPNPKHYEFELIVIASDANAQPLKTRGYYEKVWVYRGVLKTNIEEDDR